MVSTDKGFIKVFRDIQDHWIWTCESYDRAHAWVDLIMMMNHKDSKMMFDGRLITVKRGSKITSLRKLSERWGWSKDKVAAFLDALESDGMIKQVRDSRKTVLTVENYGFYQDTPDSKKTPKRRSSDAHRTLIGTNKKEEECIKKEEEEAPPFTLEELKEMGWLDD